MFPTFMTLNKRVFSQTLRTLLVSSATTASISALGSLRFDQRLENTTPVKKIQNAAVAGAIGAGLGLFWTAMHFPHLFLINGCFGTLTLQGSLASLSVAKSVATGLGLFMGTKVSHELGMLKSPYLGR